MSTSTLKTPARRTVKFKQGTLNTVYRSLFQGTPREAAERAYRHGGPSLDELEQRISNFRNQNGH